MVTNPYLSKFQKLFSPTESEAPKYTEIRLHPNCRLFAGMYDSCSVFPAFNMTLFRRSSAENQITLRKAFVLKCRGEKTRTGNLKNQTYNPEHRTSPLSAVKRNVVHKTHTFTFRRDQANVSRPNLSNLNFSINYFVLNRSTSIKKKSCT